jgi:hypothetical protein
MFKSFDHRSVLRAPVTLSSLPNNLWHGFAAMAEGNALQPCRSCAGLTTEADHPYEGRDRAPSVMLVPGGYVGVGNARVCGDRACCKIQQLAPTRSSVRSLCQDLTFVVAHTTWCVGDRICSLVPCLVAGLSPSQMLLHERFLFVSFDGGVSCRGRVETLWDTRPLLPEVALRHDSDV